MAYVNLLELIYPIGSIYMSMNNVSPASFIGGTWEPIEDKFLLGTGDYTKNQSGLEGGEFEHQLTRQELAKHWHWVGDYVDNTNGYDKDNDQVAFCGLDRQRIQGSGDTLYPFYTHFGKKDGGFEHYCATSTQIIGVNSLGETIVGGDSPHNNTPPLRFLLHVEANRVAHILASLLEVM